MASGRSSNEKSFDWKFVTASVRSQYRVSYLISVYNDLDSYDTNRSSIYVIKTQTFINSNFYKDLSVQIDQGSLSLPLGVLLKPKENFKILTAYTEYITGAAKLIRDSIGGTATNEQIDLDVQDLLQFEYELAKVNHLNNSYWSNISLKSIYCSQLQRLPPLLRQGETTLGCTIPWL